MTRQSIPTTSNTKAVFDLMTQNLPGVVWSTDRDLRFTFSIGAGLAELGLRPNEVMGQSLFEYFRTDDPEFPSIAAHRRVLQGESVSYEQTWAKRTFQVHVEPLFDGELIVGCIGIAHDITERKIAEAALQDAHDHLEDRVMQRTTELANANEQLQHEQETLKRLLSVHDQERRAIVDRIHENLAQQLIAASMQFESLDQQALTPTDVENLDSGVKILQHCVEETRRLMAGVRPLILDEHGVAVAIRNLTYECRSNHGLEIDFHNPGDFDRLMPELENALFHITEELLTNACRHSQSDRVCVRLLQTANSVEVEVRDWGVGFHEPQTPPGRGLPAIREHARIFGGAVAVDSERGAGTRIRVNLPYAVRD